MNQVQLIGRLTRDVELRYIAGSGQAVANFSLAIDRDYLDKDGKRATDFIDIQAWGKSAENCANYIGKGSLVAVRGSIRVDIYQNQQGENRRSFRINADRVQFLNSRKNNTNDEKEKTFEPSFVEGFEQEFQAIDDDDLPF